jgi:serine/threonine-protein kinase
MGYNIACELAMSLPLLAPGERAATADEAMDALQQAVDHGYRNLGQVLADRNDALAALRDRPDFEVLLMDLRFPDSPFAR